MNYACEYHQGKPLENCFSCFRAHPVIQQLRQMRETNEGQPASVHCTNVTIALGHAIEKIAELEHELTAVRAERECTEQETVALNKELKQKSHGRLHGNAPDYDIEPHHTCAGLRFAYVTVPDDAAVEIRWRAPNGAETFWQFRPRPEFGSVGIDKAGRDAFDSFRDRS